LVSLNFEGGAKPAVDKIKPVLKDMSELLEELEEAGFDSHIDYRSGCTKTMDDYKRNWSR
jgi:hypothetical protein